MPHLELRPCHNDWTREHDTQDDHSVLVANVVRVEVVMRVVHLARRQTADRYAVTLATPVSR